MLKELADNALDTGANVRIGELPEGGYFVEDDGPGIDGTPDEIARLFSINRPMVSTKLLRLPTRGALGNGLRVVAGSVLASDGFLVVITRNRRIELRPQRDGSTTVVKVTPVKFPVGTRIEIGFGPAIPEDENALYWAKVAIRMAHGQAYAGRSSPYWYDVPQFHELLSASDTAPVRELVANLDGCTGGRAGEIVAEAGLGRMACGDVSRKQAEHLLAVARSNAKQVTSKRLGAVGPELFPQYAYAMSSGEASFGTEPFAEIPYLVEAWAAEREDMQLMVCVNRTPVTGNIDAARDKREIDLFGCGLSPHRRRGTEGQALRHLAQRHDALHADHPRRQGAGPRTVSRQDRGSGAEGGTSCPSPQHQGHVAEGRRARQSRRCHRRRQGEGATGSTSASCSTSCGRSSWTRPARN